MTRILVRFAAGAFVLAALAVPAAAQEICDQRMGQYAANRTCVSSVLPPQGGRTYGPQHLNATGDGAWCEGVDGNGVGQTITMHQLDDPPVVGSVMFINGYVRNAQTFQNNARVKTALIETSGGYRRTITLKDSPKPQPIKFSPSKIEWVKLTVLDVYPGAKSSDLCVSGFALNQEEFTTD